jgi:polyhydroxybutyrate depolymerase
MLPIQRTGYLGIIHFAGVVLGCAGRASSPPKSPAPAAAQPAAHGEFESETVQVADVTRTYRLFVPRSVDLAKPAPLVFAFHGFLIDNKDAMPLYTKLNETADKHGFILVYPNAVGGSWALSPDKMVKDLAFFDALLAKLTAEHKIDPDRVYLTGMSNGGYFAHFVGKERSTVVAAVAAHSAALGLQTLLGINAERKFPVMIIHGDKDNVIAVATARENRDRYRKEGHEVNYVEVPGLSHWWATDAGINDRIWAFFADHPRGNR